MKNQIPLAQRLETLGPSPVRSPLQFVTLMGLFRAVGKITHLPYPWHRYRQISNAADLDCDTLYTQALSLPYRELSQGTRDPDCEAQLEQMLIEPLAAIYHIWKEECDHV